MAKISKEIQDIQITNNSQNEFTLKGFNNDKNINANNLFGINNKYIYSKKNFINLKNKNNIINKKNNNNKKEMNYNFSNITNNIKNYFTLNNNNESIKKDKINKYLNTKDNSNFQNNNSFSKINDYWKKREEKNKLKMEKIKEERQQKLYGNIYPIPKINKNSKEIINKIKENQIIPVSEEDQIEDTINRNIPIKTEKRNTFFNNKNKYNIIDYKDSYVRLIKLKNYKKRSTTPKPKNLNSLIKKKIPNNFQNHKIKKVININEIKNLEKINRLRKERNKYFQYYPKSKNVTDNNENKI